MTASIDIFDYFHRVHSTVAAVARFMVDHDLSPRDVLDAYEARMAASASARSVPAPRRPGRSRAGDVARPARACPKCGGTVEMLQLCPRSSPRWRTQLACMTDGCDWHGLSELPLDALLAAGPEGFKHHVETPC